MVRRIWNCSEASVRHYSELDAINPKLRHQPSVSMWSPDHEVWLSLVVGLWAGEERSSRKEEGRKEEVAC